MTDIYQTLQDRGNYEEIESHGPYFCSLYDSDGNLKKGTKEPWLGEGYYFWDTRIKDAQWWGQTIYGWNRYVICHTQYDQNSPLLFDMVGVVSHFDEFVSCAEIIKKDKMEDTVSFPVVLEYLKLDPGFNYKAIRVWPDPENQVTSPQTGVFFPGYKAGIRSFEKIQICFFDKTLLIRPFTIVEKHQFGKDFTI